MIKKINFNKDKKELILNIKRNTKGAKYNTRKGDWKYKKFWKKFWQPERR